jgi:cytolethal distending toxin subunit B
VKLMPRLRMRRGGGPAARWRTAVRLAGVAALAGGLLSTGAAPAQAAPLEEHAPATYNMQGSQGGDLTPKWSTDIPALLANHDVLALQEAGPVPPQTQTGPFVYQDSTTNFGYTVYHYLRNFGTSSRPVLRHVYFMETDPNGHRVNLAMVSAALPDRVWITPPAITGVSRASFGLQFGNTVFNDIHALSGGGGDAGGLLADIAFRQGFFGYDWAVLGDFNTTPNTLIGRGLPAGSHLYRPGVATQISGGELDYMVSSADVLLYEGHAMPGISSDHWPVEFAVAPLRAAAGYSIGSYSAYTDQERVADIQGNSSSNGTHLIVYDNLGGGNQHFNFEPTPDGLFNIRNQSTGKCLDLNNGSRADAGSYVNEWDCQGQDTQKWDVESWGTTDPGAVEITNWTTGMCLDVRGANPNNGTWLDIWPCVGSQNQEFTLQYLGFTLETA